MRSISSGLFLYFVYLYISREFMVVRGVVDAGIVNVILEDVGVVNTAQDGSYI